MPSASFPRHTTLSEEEKVRVGVAAATAAGRVSDVTITYPDGTTGACRYERLAPAYHRFDFCYHDGTRLPRQYLTRPVSDIAMAAQELTERAFEDAVAWERREYFARAVPPPDGSRKPDPTKFRLDPKKVKQVGGKYALCLRIGTKLLAVSGPYDTLAEANAKWQDKGTSPLVVACCNRLDRCWQEPKFNPLRQQIEAV